MQEAYIEVINSEEATVGCNADNAIDDIIRYFWFIFDKYLVKEVNKFYIYNTHT